MKLLIYTTFFSIIIIFGFSSCTSTLNVSTNPSGGKVIIGNESSGKTPIRKSIKIPSIGVGIKVYDIKGYEPFDTIVYPKKGVKEHFVEIDLVKKDTSVLPLLGYTPKLKTDGIKLEFYTKPTVSYNETIERNTNVKTVTRVTNFTLNDIQVFEPNVSPKGDVVVFPLYKFDPKLPQNGYSNIYSAKIGGTALTKVTTGGENENYRQLDLYPHFNPSGEDIYFSSDRNSDNSRLWRVKSLGAGGIVLIGTPNSRAADISPTPLKDEDEIVFASLLEGVEWPQIWKIKSNGTLPTQLREGESPDINLLNNNIVFIRENRNIVLAETILKDTIRIYHPYQIFTMTSEGLNETQLTQNIQHNCISPKWSPDGKWIVYASNEGKDSRGQMNYDIWMMKSDGTQPTQLTTNGSYDDSPCWSPDGKRIYFRSNRGGAWNIWFFELNTN